MIFNAMILPCLFYLVAPLNAASITGLLKLQSVQNKAIKFLLNTNWSDMERASELHTRAKFKPVNQILHNRAKALWDKITEGTAADKDICREILRIPYTAPKTHFPSSYERALKPEPPPIYTNRDAVTQRVKDHYLQL